MITHPLLTTFLLILFTQFHFSLGLTCEPICSFDLSPRNTICTPERCVQVKCSPPRCRYVCDSDTGFGINDNNECIKQGIKPSCRVACTKGVFGAIDTHKHCQTQCSQVQSTSPCRSENGCRLECENEIPNCVLGCVGGTNDAGKCQQFVREKQKYPLQCRQHAICNNGNDGDGDNNNNDLIIFEDELSNDGDDEFGVVKKNVGHFNPNNNNNNNQTQGTNLNNKNSNNNNDNFNIDLYNTNSPKQEGEEDTCDDEDSFDHDEHNGYNNKTQKQQNDNNNQNNLNDNNTENDEQIKKIEQIHFYENCCTCRDIDNLTLSYQSALNRIMKSTAEYNQDNIPTLTELIQYYHQYGFQNCCQCAQKEKEKEKEKN